MIERSGVNMRIMKVIKIEDKFVLCEGEEKRIFALPVEEVAEGVKTGDTIEITDDGEVLVNA